MPMWTSLSFQNILSNVNSYLESLHDLLMVWLTIILLIVCMVFMLVVISFMGKLNLDSKSLEITWTIIPILILLSLAYPSVLLLCLQDSIKQQVDNTVKLTSRQWSWSSEYLNDLVDHLLDYDMLDNLSSFENPMILPLGINRMMMTSSDVLHSLGVPGLGVKLDLIPGRLNYTTLQVLHPGLNWGSCFELCGSGHSAMPIIMFT